MNNKILKILKTIGKENFMLILSITFSIQIFAFLSIYLFKKSILAVHMIPFILTISTFILLKDFVDEKSKNTGFIILKISLFIMVCAFFNHPIVAIANKFEDIKKVNSFLKINYLIDIIIGLSCLTVLKNENIKEKLDFIKNNSFVDILFVSKGVEEIEVGDIVLCKDIETGKPVILPHKDRYLHMLILGPTGSGKTSQSIIPMIHQDMQNLECGITVIEPKGDLAEKIYAMAKYYDRPVMYFNPILPECPYFNPLFGNEDDVIENMATTFKMLNPDSPQFFQDMNEQLIRNALKVLKRLRGNNATLIELGRLIQNSGGVGRKMVTAFSRLNVETEIIAKENADISAWFLNEYFNEKSKTYEHCSGLRSQVAKIISNKHLREVLNPPEGKNDIDFDTHLANGGIIAIATAQGTLGDLGRFLGYFIILQFQSSVLKRPGNEDTRRAHFLYIDEFQVYSNPGFANMLTQGRSYRVASHLATQNRALIGMGGGADGKNFVELVSTNARNVIIYPGGNAIDAKYYSEQFGEKTEKSIDKGISRTKLTPFTVFQSKAPTESIREVEETKARFSPTDIMYRKFGEITYCMIKKNSIQIPGVGKISYIPKELNDKLDEMVEEYNESVFKRCSTNIENTEESIESNVDVINSKTEIPDIIGNNEIMKKEAIVDSNSQITSKKSESEIDSNIDLSENKSVQIQIPKDIEEENMFDDDELI